MSNVAMPTDPPCVPLMDSLIKNPDWIMVILTSSEAP